MPQFLLNLKPWQAFLLVFVLPFLLQYGLEQLVTSSNELVRVCLDALPSVFYTMWLWLIGTYLYRRLPGSIQIRGIYFHLAMLYFLLYTLLLLYTISIVRESVFIGKLPLGMLFLLVPLHLLATFCFLYAVYFVSRSLASIEQGGVVETGAYVRAFFLFLFLPLGIWFLQPRLKGLLLKETT
ncbi:hypothetical protein CLV24_101251 [Pontibacter ummariensis]|uniref:Uncharacterized protein n=1 Tax=Pontibacter ummariensis TaxID=1610492 RepID=A0A239B9H6_9BACT|nr:hypothetical protein [Pontibacter ummariensis]PRY16405.1 hypothetical protein CLV24_101251 [Pontibacter ummariensis]SNS04586.1 hypothetical protein SAMN06296052_101251 [Pontibacter ummariensis]